MPYDKIFNEILTSGGVWGAISLILGTACVYLYLHSRNSESLRIKDAQQCSSEKALSYEKRIEEMGRMTAALEKTSSMSLSLISSLDALETTTGELVKVVAVLVESFKTEREIVRNALDRVERRQDRILEKIPSRHESTT